MRVLVIGNGGRENAIAWKVAQNDSVEKIYCAPGNGGTAIEKKCENVNLSKKQDLLEFAKERNIDLTIVGPEVPLVDGIVDDFKAAGLKIFGPARDAAQLEGSKAFSKDFMKKYGVKTAYYEVFEDKNSALEYLKKCEYPSVIKADGLAAGKGVVICNNYEEAEKTIEEFMVQDIFKGSGKKIVVEEFLEGVEASILSITDGNVIIPFLSAKDHKTIFEENKGPNTGGMGAITPNPYCSEDVLKQFEESILVPTLKGIIEENLDYTGIIFFGVMITKKGTYLLEYNVRLGDPETQVVLPMMKSDLTELILSALDKKLKDYTIQWYTGSACCVVAASGGYPASYKTGYTIDGIQDVNNKVFIAGASAADDSLKTSGGRVLCTSAIGNDLTDAISKAYEDIQKIKFKDIYYRKDIGKLY